VKSWEDAEAHLGMTQSLYHDMCRANESALEKGGLRYSRQFAEIGHALHGGHAFWCVLRLLIPWIGVREQIECYEAKIEGDCGDISSQSSPCSV